MKTQYYICDESSLRHLYNKQFISVNLHYAWGRDWVGISPYVMNNNVVLINHLNDEEVTLLTLLNKCVKEFSIELFSEEIIEIIENEKWNYI